MVANLIVGEQVFLQKHTTEKEQRWVSGNSVFFRMHRISDIYFVGGFGTVQWVDVAEYAAVKPDEIVMTDPHTTLRVGTQRFLQACISDKTMTLCIVS